MPKIYENVRIYNGEDSEAAVAPKGTVFQGGIGPSETPFVDVGWISEDGVGEEISADTEAFRGFQGNKVVKRIIPESEVTFTVQALEENAVVHGLKTRGAEVTVEAGVATTVRNKDTATDERTWRIRLIADDATEKVYEFTGTHTLSGTIEHTATELTIHEFTVTPIGDVTEYTDNPDIVAAGTVTP